MLNFKKRSVYQHQYSLNRDIKHRQKKIKDKGNNKIMPKLPHIVIFNPDQWRGDTLGHLGNPAAITPNLDRIVQEDGVSFANAFCQNTVCTPSRCSFMTGLYPHVNGHRTMLNLLKPNESNLLKNLKKAGYYVWWGGKNDLLSGQDRHNESITERYKPSEDTSNMWMIDREKEWRGSPEDNSYYSFYAGKLEKTKGHDYYYDYDWANVNGAINQINNQPTENPLCIYLPLTYPHPPYAVEEPWFSMINRAKLPKRIPAPENWTDKPSMVRGIFQRQNLCEFSEEQWNELRAVYYGMCTRVDHQFGLLVGALKKAGIYNDTAIFFFSDHGDFTGDYGIVEKTQNTFEDCLSRVPFLVKPPSWIKTKPGVRNALVELVDFPATVEVLAGLKPEHTHFGRSLLPLIVGETDKHRDAVFCEGGRLYGEPHCAELMPDGKPFPKESFYWPRISLQNEDGPEHTKAAMCRTHEFKYVKRFYEQDEFYDLTVDPYELYNEINNPKYKTILAALKERLSDWFMETADHVPVNCDQRNFQF
jgi:arylsulfatase A-like enzyme